jgi:hypothetical protein
MFFEIVDVPTDEITPDKAAEEKPGGGDNAVLARTFVHVGLDEGKGLHVHTFSYKVGDLKS